MPAPIDQILAAALQHHQAGHFAEAEALYRQVLDQQPRNVDALHLLGVLHQQTGRNEAAIEFIERAIALRPGDAKFYYHLGIALNEVNRLDETIAVLRRSLELRPRHAESLRLLGSALARVGKSPDEVIAVLTEFCALKSDDADAHYNLGVALSDRDRLDEAIAAYTQAVRFRPQWAEAHSNLATALAKRGRLDEALARFRHVISLQPDLPLAHSNLGHTLLAQNKVSEAIASLERALALQADFADAHWNLAMALLVSGDLARGFAEYEWRWKRKDHSAPMRDLAKESWSLQAAPGQRVLVHVEQGLGDAIQFARYLPMLAHAGAQVILECQPEVAPLLADLPGVAEICRYGQPLPAFDLQVPMMSLPAKFGTTLATVPAPIPYLHADAAKVSAWRKRFSADRAKFHVGLAWAGRATHKADRTRSISLAAMAPLGNAAGVQFYSLQKGPAAVQAYEAPAGLKLIDLDQELQDFTDTAAAIEALDLVITVDTAVAHLGGALGKKVWTLLAFSPDWRWLLDRADTPWYPTMRLFRQRAIGRWDDVIAEVAAQLAREAGARK